MANKIQQRAFIAKETRHDEPISFQDEKVEELTEARTTPGGAIAFTGNSMGVRGDTLPQVPEMIYSAGDQIRAMSDRFPAVATILFDFAGDRKLPDDTVFTRTREQSYYDFEGILRFASTNQPAFTHDPETKTSLGLLMEDSARNEALWSEDFTNGVWSGGVVTSNFATAPDATNDAARIVQVGGAGADFAKQSVTPDDVGGVTSGEVIHFSVFMKLTGTNEGDGTVDLNVDSDDAGPTEQTKAQVTLTSSWQRVTVSHTFAATYATYAIATKATASGPTEVLIWGAQSELAIASSYIVTTDETRIRGVCALNAPSYLPLINLSEGTWFAQFILNQLLGLSNAIFFVDDGGSADRLRGFLTDGGLLQGESDSSDPPSQKGTSTTPSNFDANEPIGYAFSYSLNDVTAFSNRATGSTDVSATLPLAAASRFRVASFNGIIGKLAYYDERLANDRAEALSAKPGLEPITLMIGDF